MQLCSIPPFVQGKIRIPHGHPGLGAGQVTRGVIRDVPEAPHAPPLPLRPPLGNPPPLPLVRGGGSIAPPHPPPGGWEGLICIQYRWSYINATVILGHKFSILYPNATFLNSFPPFFITTPHWPLPLSNPPPSRHRVSLIGPPFPSNPSPTGGPVFSEAVSGIMEKGLFTLLLDRDDRAPPPPSTVRGYPCLRALLVPLESEGRAWGPFPVESQFFRRRSVVFFIGIRCPRNNPG